MKNKHLKRLAIVFLSLLFLVQSSFAGPAPDITGESAILMDRKTGAILYKKNAFIEMYPASTTKVLTSIICIENMDLSSLMTKTNHCIQHVPSDSSHVGLRVGDTFSVLDGIYTVMLGSDNYIAHELGVLLDGSIEGFSARMNRKAREIGAKQSNFINPHGYHHPDHYTTAYDLALITNYAFENQLFRTIASQAEHVLERHNDLLNPITFPHTVQLLQTSSPYYSPYVIGGKTGFNTPAGRSLVALANKDGMELIGVVLKSTSPEFFEDMNALFEYGFDNFKLMEQDGDTLLVNQSFSAWAKEKINFALNHNLIDHDTQNYQKPISKQDFINLLKGAAYMAENGQLDGFSSQSMPMISNYNSPITRELAASLTSEFLSSLNHKPIFIYPIQHYTGHTSISDGTESQIYNLQQALSWEQAISIIVDFYNSYLNSPQSFINANIKRAGCLLINTLPF